MGLISMAKVSHFQSLARCETFWSKSRETFARLRDQFYCLKCLIQEIQFWVENQKSMENDWN